MLLGEYMSGLFDEEPTIEVFRSNENGNAQPQDKSIKTRILQQTYFTDPDFESLSLYSNPLLENGVALMAILVSIPHQNQPHDLARFRQKILDLLDEYRARGRYLDEHPSVIDKACFVFAAAFDEAIVHTPWGQSLGWENYSILSKLFMHRNGGEVFFSLLDKAMQQPSKLVDFLELQYVLLMLGFEGRYRGVDESKLHQIKSDIYQQLRQYRPDFTFEPLEVPELIATSRPWYFIDYRKLLFFVIGVLLMIYMGSEYEYFQEKQHLYQSYTQFDLNAVIPDKDNGELVYNSTAQDLSDAPLALSAQTVESKSKLNSQNQWNIVLGRYRQARQASERLKMIQELGYDALTRDTDQGIEVYIHTSGDLNEVQRFKRDIEISTSMDAVIQRVKD